MFHLSLFTDLALAGLRVWTNCNSHPLHILKIYLFLMPSVPCPRLIMIYWLIQLLLIINSASNILFWISSVSELWSYCLSVHNRSSTLQYNQTTPNAIIISCSMLGEIYFVILHYCHVQRHTLQTSGCLNANWKCPKIGYERRLFPEGISPALRHQWQVTKHHLWQYTGSVKRPDRYHTQRKTVFLFGLGSPVNKFKPNFNMEN